MFLTACLNLQNVTNFFFDFKDAKKKEKRKR